MRALVATHACLLLLAGLAPGLLYAQPAKVVEVEHADTLIGTTVNGEQARELAGNVRFVHGDVRVWCDRATQFLASGKLLLNGNVLVKDDSVTLRAPRGSYHQTERKAEAYDGVLLNDGNVMLTAREGEYFLDEKRAFFRSDVVVRDGQSTVTSDSLTYFRREKRSIATGNVVVEDRSQNLSITGGYLEHWSDRQFSWITDEPELVQVDTTSSEATDTLVVRSRVMESYRGEVRKLTAIDSVRIVRKDLAAIAGKATFFPDGDSILLRTMPVIWYGQTQVSGDSVNVYMKNRILDLVHVFGNSFAVSRTDSLGLTRYDQLMGEEMRLRFVDRRLDGLEVDRRAISLYHLYEDSVANGINRTSGDRIVMAFLEGKLHEITVIGGVEGLYVPENLLRGREEEYHLARFLWREDRPRMTARETRRQRASVP
jgi:lipopolysaccharide export system protein LptA